MFAMETEVDYIPLNTSNPPQMKKTMANGIATNPPDDFFLFVYKPSLFLLDFVQQLLRQQREWLKKLPLQVACH